MQKIRKTADVEMIEAGAESNQCDDKVIFEKSDF